MSRNQRDKNASLLTITDEELIGHPALAYLDGYADARNWGQQGYFINAAYGPHDRESYALGFKKGLRVHRVSNNSA